MPYTNIVWVKFKLELLSDYRFTDKLNDLQKLVFLGLLLLAGDTKNYIPFDENYIKRRLNLEASSEDIKNAIHHIISVFPKIKILHNHLCFLNFQKLHNWKEGEKKEKNRRKKGEKKDFQEEDKEEDKDKDKEEDKEKEKEYNNIIVDTDKKSVSTTTPQEKYFNQVKEFFDNPPSNWLEEIKKTYPSINIQQELAKMKVWLISNYPAQQKRNFKRFAINWLNKTLDYYHKKGGDNNARRPKCFSENEDERRKLLEQPDIVIAD